METARPRFDGVVEIFIQRLYSGSTAESFDMVFGSLKDGVVVPCDFDRCDLVIAGFVP